MNITTKSIIDDLEIQYNKPIESITLEDVLNTKSITIKKLGYNNEINHVDYKELIVFKNIEVLNIFDCMITSELLNIIIDLKNLKALNFYNCDFIDDIGSFFEMINVEEITLNNCIGLSNIKIQNLNRLELKNINLDFYITNVDNLLMRNIKNKINNEYLLNINKITIALNDYNNNSTNMFLSKLEIVNDREEIVKVIEYVEG